MSNLNIAKIFFARPHLGGSGIMAMESAKELARRGHSIDIVSYPGSHLSEEEKELGISLHAIPRIDYPCFKAEPYTTTLASTVANLFLKEGKRVDIIHAHYAITHGEAALMARDMIRRQGGDSKVVITNHGSDIHTNGHHTSLAPALEFVLERADTTTYVSRALQDEARAMFSLSDYGKVIGNFVDENRFEPPTYEEKQRARREMDIPTDAVVICHASNFRPVKQTQLLVESARKLESEGSECYFLFVGDGPDKPGLQDKAEQEYGLCNVRFVGRQEEVAPYFQVADVGILSSKREGCPLTLLEAMACGIPVIGPEVGGIPEIIDHGETGYLFSEGDLNAMSYLISKIAREEERRRTMGNAARKKARETFSRRAVVDKYEDLYESIRSK